MGRENSMENYLANALDSFENGDYSEAVRYFEEIHKEFPRHPLAMIMLARVAIELNDYDKALENLFGHLEHDPDSVEAIIYVGLALFQRKELDLAEKYFTKALELRQTSEMIRENLAITRMQAGKFMEAIDDLVELHNENPNDLKILELLILALGRGGKWEAAKQYAIKLQQIEMNR